MKIYNTKNVSEYDLIVLGGGASGLFLGASLNLNGKSGLIIEASDTLGKKILASGGGRCNFTHAGSIKDFIPCYHSLSSKAESFVRSPLYKFNNLKTRDFFESIGVLSYSQDDGRIFPSSNKSISVRNALVKKCELNSWTFSLNTRIVKIENNKNNNYSWLLKSDDGGYFATKNLVISAGSPAWKYDDYSNQIFDDLKNLGVKIVNPLPALTPINIKIFNMKSLSGISFENASLSLINSDTKKSIYKNSGDILITETGFSGPLALNSSWFINKLKSECFLKQECKDFELIIELKEDSFLHEFDFHGVNLSLSNAIKNYSSLPERYIRFICGDFSDQKASSVPLKKIHAIINNIYKPSYSSSLINNSSFENAMSALGGVSLDEINNKTFQCKSLKGLYVIGEALDISGDSGGYNLQFMWSSAMSASLCLARDFARILIRD